jgi:integrase/recombinase XerD
VLKDWRRRKRQQAEPPPAVQAGSFVRDIVRFLKARRHLASFKSDRAHLRPWVHRFTRLTRWAITTEMIDTAISDWTVAGYSPREIRHRVKILQQLYRTMAPGDKTPCDGAKVPRLPRPNPMAVSDAVIREVGLQLRKQELTGKLRDAKTRARYLILATTGQRPSQLMRALPMDVDRERRVWHVRPGKGGLSSTIYLNDDMLNAWDLFIAAKAWGRYDARSFAKTLQRNGWPTGIRPYNLRHTVGLRLSELGVDLGDIQAFMGHTSPTTTRIYVPPVPNRLRQASTHIEERIGQTAAGPHVAPPTAISADPMRPRLVKKPATDERKQA